MKAQIKENESAINHSINFERDFFNSYENKKTLESFKPYLLEMKIKDKMIFNIEKKCKLLYEKAPDFKI